MNVRITLDWTDGGGLMVRAEGTRSMVILLGILESSKDIIRSLETQAPVSPELLAMPTGQAN